MLSVRFDVNFDRKHIACMPLHGTVQADISMNPLIIRASGEKREEGISGDYKNLVAEE
jgi:hypothetical protein